MTMLSTYRRSVVNNIVRKLFVKKNDRHFSIDFKTVPINCKPTCCKPNLVPCSILLSNINNKRSVGFRYFTDTISIVRRYVRDSPDIEEDVDDVDEPASKDLVTQFEDYRPDRLTPFAVMPDIDSTYDEFELGDNDEEDFYESDDEDDVDVAEP